MLHFLNHEIWVDQRTLRFVKFKWKPLYIILYSCKRLIQLIFVCGFEIY